MPKLFDLCYRECKITISSTILILTIIFYQQQRLCVCSRMIHTVGNV